MLKHYSHIRLEARRKALESIVPKKAVLAAAYMVIEMRYLGDRSRDQCVNITLYQVFSSAL